MIKFYYFQISKYSIINLCFKLTSCKLIKLLTSQNKDPVYFKKYNNFNLKFQLFFVVIIYYFCLYIQK